MTMTVRCPNPKCAKAYSVPENLRGQRVRCRDCRTEWSAAPVPTPSRTPAQPRFPQMIGRYQIQGPLQADSLGMVYRAYDPQQDREITLRVLSREILSAPQAEQRFLREVRVAAKMEHPHIVPLLHVSRQANDYLIVSGAIRGRRLVSLIPPGGLEARRAVQLVLNLVDVLMTAHQGGIPYVGLTSESLILDSQSSLQLVHLGVPTWARSNRLKNPYLPPEWVGKDLSQAGSFVDIYGAGVILYQLMTGRLPFEGASSPDLIGTINGPLLQPSWYRSGLDPELEKITLLAVSKDPQERFPDAVALGRALHEWLSLPTPNLAGSDTSPLPSASRGTPQMPTPPGPTPRGAPATSPMIGEWEPPFPGSAPELPMGNMETPGYQQPPVTPRNPPAVPPAPPHSSPPSVEEDFYPEPPDGSSRTGGGFPRTRRTLLPLVLGVVGTLTIGLLMLAGGWYFLSSSSTPPVGPEPARKEMHGGIEIGSKGVKAVFLKLFPAENDYGFDFTFKDDSNNTNLVTGLKEKGKFDPVVLKETAAAVGAYYRQMRQEHNIPPERIYIVASSGLFSPIQNDPDNVQQNRHALSQAVAKATEGKKMDFITPEGEVHRLIKGTIPPRFMGSSVLLDVGSGNTKGGYQVGQDTYKTWDMPYGTRTYKTHVVEQVQARGGDYAELASKLRTEFLRPRLQKVWDLKPGFRAQDRIYLSGGIVWALSNFVHPDNKKGLFLKLSAKDIDEFHRMLRANPGTYPEVDLGSIADEAIQKKAAKDIKIVKKVFTAQELLAGCEVLLALSEEFEFGNSTRQMYFARFGLVSWLISYVVEQREKSG